MSDRYPEEDYYQALVTWLRAQGFCARAYVPIMSRVMDVAAVTKMREVWAFEVKLNDWRRGLRQAQRYLLAADRSYLVVPPKLAGRVGASKEELTAQGIGLVILAHGGVPDFIMPAVRSNRIVPDIRGHILSLVVSEA